MKILIVDDNKEMAKLMKEFLEINGHTVNYAIDGFEGVMEYNNGNYDVVIMDIVLPGIDGIEATRLIKSHTPGAKIILVTGLPDSSVSEQKNELGVKYILEKPVDLKDLVEIIGTISYNEDAKKRIFKEVSGVGYNRMPQFVLGTENGHKLVFTFDEARNNKEIHISIEDKDERILFCDYVNTTEFIEMIKSARSGVSDFKL